MYELIRRLTFKELTQEQLPLLVMSLGIAELSYKFHSFLLEAGAFLLTWLALGALSAAIKPVLLRVKGDAHEI